MIYISRIEIPATTAAHTPVFELVDVSLPLLKHAIIIFEKAAAPQPAGCRIMERQSNIIPAILSPELWIRDNGQIIPLDFTYRMQYDPYQIRIEAYNTGQDIVDLEVYLTNESWDMEQLFIDELKGIRKDMAMMASLLSDKEWIRETIEEIKNK